MPGQTINEYVRGELEAAKARNFSSPQAEAAVIGSFLRKGSANRWKLTTLHDDDFTDDSLRKIFMAIKATAAKGQDIDLVTTDATFTAMFPQESGVLSQRMIDAVQQVTTAGYIDSYIHIVTELAARRRSIAMINDIAAKLKDPTIDVNETLERLRQHTGEVANSTHRWVSLSDVLISTFEKLEQRAKGGEKSVTTGIGNIDRLVGGFYPGELTIIGARPGVGKSAFGANIALAAAKDGMKVGIVSREMTNIQFGQRLLAHGGNIDGMKLRKAKLDDEDWGAIADGMTMLADLSVSFLFTVNTIEDLRIEAQKKVEKKELDLLIVDYLQIMRTTQRFSAEYLRVGYISRALKDIALDFQIPVVALAQVSRDTDGQMPSLKSLKDSGAIEQDADGVIFLHRPTSADDPYVDRRDREAFHEFKKKGLTYICIGVAKQRQGTIGQACVLFDSKHMRYIQIAREEPNGGNTYEQRPARNGPANPDAEQGEQLRLGY